MIQIDENTKNSAEECKPDPSAVQNIVGQNMFLSLTKPVTTKGRKLKALSVSQKLRLLNEVEKGNRKKKDIAKEFGIPPSTLSTIYKSREKLQEFAEVTLDSNRKRMKKAKHPDVEEETLKWLSSIQDLNMPISGNIIREKAQWFAELLGHKDFQASVGWLEKFRSRYLYIARSLQKKATSATNVSDFHKWVNDILPRIVKDYGEHNIFCANETCLFYKCLLDKNMINKCDYFSEQQVNEWVTLLIATNMSGSQKLPLVVVGKVKNPACLSHLKSFPVQYEYSRNACMTAKLFEEWLTKLDEKFYSENRKIALIINNNPAHKGADNLKSIKLYSLPPNLAPHIQPVDQGIVRSLKYFYRKNMVLKFISSLNETEQASASLLNCMRDIHMAWESVLPSVISSSFKKAGLLTNIKAENAGYDFALENDDIQEEWRKLQESSCIPSDMTFESYVNIDENFMLLAHISDNEIINELLYGDKDSEEMQPDSKALEVPSLKDTLLATENLRGFIESRENVPTSVFQAISYIEQFLLNEKCSYKNDQ